jgi:hypothetical protein
MTDAPQSFKSPTLDPDGKIWPEFLPDTLAPAAALFEAAIAPPPMANRPVVTMVTTAPTGTLIRELRASTNGPVDMAGDPHFLYDGAPEYAPVAANPGVFVKPGLLPGGDAQAAYYQSNVAFLTDRVDWVAVKLRCGATSTGLRVLVDRRWVSTELMRFTGLTAGGTSYLLLRFPSKRVREIAVVDSGSTLAFGGVIVPTGTTLTRPPENEFKVAALMDSYGGGAGAPPEGATRLETWINFLVRALEEYLGVRISFRNYGIGGTGNIATTTPFSTRMDAILAYAPDLLIPAGSQNDDNSSAIRAAVDALGAKAGPIQKVIATGPVKGGYPSNNAQVKAGWEAAGRVFIDSMARWTSAADLGPDGQHLTFEGHIKQARGFLEAVLAAWFLPQTVTAGSGGGTTPVTPTPTYADILDTFARTASTGTSFGTTDNGKTWVANTSGGTIVIDADGAGWSASSTTLWNSIAAAANGILKATRSKGTGKGGRLIFRQTGGTYLMFYGNGTYYAFLRMVNGTVQGSAVVTTVVPANGDVIEVAMDGDFVSVKVNGTIAYSSTDAANSTGGTGVGIATFTTALDSRWSRFEFTEKRA